jgi:OmpA-OmpF porin, OOP family
MSVEVARMAIILSALYSTMSISQTLYPTSLMDSLKDSDQDGVIDARDLCANTPVGVDVDNTGCPLTKLEYYRFNFDVQFDTASYKLKEGAYAELDDLALFLQQKPITNLLIEGHTDNTGTPRINLLLSKQRAIAVSSALTSNFGINKNRIKTFGYGQERPVASNDTEQGKRLNRRVSGDIVVPFRTPDGLNQNASQKLQVPHKLTLSFGRNKYSIKASYRSELEAINKILQDHPDTLVIVEGYTDSTGSKAYNQRLSLERANMVAHVIRSFYPIDADRIKTIGYGQDFPIASNQTQEGRIMNRRVDTTIVQRFKASQEVVIPKWTIWSVDQLDKE